MIRNFLWTTVWILFALWVTGVLWLVLEHWVRVSSEFGTNRWSGQSKVLQLHGWLSAIGIFLLGSLTGLHVIPQWYSRQKRKSGLFLFIVFIFLAVSGTALYYVSSEVVRSWTAVAHWAVGLILPTIVAVHIFSKMRRLK